MLKKFLCSAAVVGAVLSVSGAPAKAERLTFMSGRTATIPR